MEQLEFKETSFDKASLAKYKHIHIVVLGAGYIDNSNLSKTSQLGGTVALRLMEALTLYELHDSVMLVTSGAKLDRTRSQAEAVADAALALGVSSSDTAYLANTLNTEHEAEMYVKRFGTEIPTFVVSSARHGKRAVFWFQHLGVKNIQFVPCDYMTKADPNQPSSSWQPSLKKATIFHKYLHEQVGFLYAKMKTRK